VSGSIAYVVTAGLQCNSLAARKCIHIDAESNDKLVVEQIHRDKKVPEWDSCQFYIAVKIGNRMRISAS
jgi:hypothetical protein